jgi:arylsulfatase A
MRSFCHNDRGGARDRDERKSSATLRKGFSVFQFLARSTRVLGRIDCRRFFSRHLLQRLATHTFFGFVALFTQILYTESLTAESGDRPNVVFILADDLGWGEVGCFGQKKILTPNIDGLASTGMKLTQHYSGAPVCAPSRCVLMTGKHLGHAEIRGNSNAKAYFPEFDQGQYPLSQSAITFPMLFKQAGYATGAMGKWGLGPVGSTGDPNRKGFDLFYGYNCQAVAHSYYPSYLWRNNEKVTINTKAIPGHAKQPEGLVTFEDWIGENYAPDLVVAEAEKFIKQHTNKPFFLYLPFIEPHVAMHPPKDRVEAFPEEWDSEVYRGGNGYLPHPRPRAGYAAMIANLDNCVGKVLKVLDDQKLRENTLIIFSSDNGSTHGGKQEPRFHVGGADPVFFHSTADLRGYKGSVYEGGIRVPTIASWPGKIAPQSTSDQPSYFADWFPTLCDALGFDKPDGLDGVSLLSILKGKEKLILNRKPMLWIFPEYGGQIAIRIGDYKLIRQQLATKTPGPWEVYNIEKDRSERRDIANEHPELIQQAEALLARDVSENKIFPMKIPK